MSKRKSSSPSSSKICTKRDVLELMLEDENAQPGYLPISLLRVITNDFSDDQKIGQGGFAIVYKGQLKNGTVAVKKLSPELDVDEKKFTQEVANLMKLRHKNIVRFMGYCADTQGKLSKHEGKNVMADERERLLCFEFLPKGGLDKHITDASEGLGWTARCRIIKGICEGLHYLHSNFILHLDLKPANILLNCDMVPKIADFGLSRRFDENQSRALATEVIGTVGYMAPEYSFRKQITFKSDIYSLGLMISAILTGRSGYVAVEDVVGSWKSRLKASEGDARLEQVRVCTDIAMECIESDPAKRPDAKTITERLSKMERTYGFIDPGLPCTLLDTHVHIHPLELHLRSRADGLTCGTINLTNRTHLLHVGIWITQTSQNYGYPYRFRSPGMPLREGGTDHFFGIIEPQTTQLVDVIGSSNEKLLPSSYELKVLTIISDSKEQLEELNSSLGDKINMGRKVLGVEVLWTKRVLKILTCDPPIPSYFVQHPWLVRLSIWFNPIDVHPTQTWILMASCGGADVCIVNYQTREIVTELRVQGTSDHSPVKICSAILIARHQWFAIGDRSGQVHIYNYSTKDRIKQFQSHGRVWDEFGRDASISILAAHPSKPYLLTSSYSKAALIKLWDWSQDWVCTRTIHVSSDSGPERLIWNPSDTYLTFACLSKCGRLKVYEIDSEGSTLQLDLEHICRARFIDVDRQPCLLVTKYNTSEFTYHMLDWHTKECVHRFGRNWSRLLTCLSVFVWHPTLPIFVTTYRYRPKLLGIQLWHARTYRLLETFPFEADDIKDIIFIGTNDLARLMVRSETWVESEYYIIENFVSVIDINLPLLRTVEMIDDQNFGAKHSSRGYTDVI